MTRSKRSPGQLAGSGNSLLRQSAVMLLVIGGILAWVLQGPSLGTGDTAQAGVSKGPGSASVVSAPSTLAPAESQALDRSALAESAVTSWVDPVSGPAAVADPGQAKRGSRKHRKAKAMVGNKAGSKTLAQQKGSKPALGLRSRGGQKRPGQGLPGLVLQGGPGFKKPDEGGTTFQFKVRVDTPFSVTVRSTDGVPLPFAQVSVVAALAPPPPGVAIEDMTSPDGWFDGFTDAMGSAMGTLSLPTAAVEVDLVVLLGGYEGEYTHEQLRALWGPFAPAARISVPVQKLAGLVIELSKD